jgi:putative N-acetylmannosamine-6-phosphate epimerase
MPALIGRLNVNDSYSTAMKAGAHAVCIDSAATHMTERNENKWK